MTSSKGTCIEVNIIKLRQNGVKVCFVLLVLKSYTFLMFVHFSCSCTLRQVMQKLKLLKRVFVQNFPAKMTS